MEGNGGEKKEGEKEQKILTPFCLCKIKYRDLFVFFSSAFSASVIVQKGYTRHVLGILASRQVSGRAMGIDYNVQNTLAVTLRTMSACNSFPSL